MFTGCVSRVSSSPAQALFNRLLIVSSTSRPCCVAVLTMLDRTANAFAPDALRLPPVIFLITTAGRIARSAALFVERGNRGGTRTTGRL